jgi:hypothetical protein
MSPRRERCLCSRSMSRGARIDVPSRAMSCARSPGIVVLCEIDVSLGRDLTCEMIDVTLGSMSFAVQDSLSSARVIDVTLSYSRGARGRPAELTVPVASLRQCPLNFAQALQPVTGTFPRGRTGSNPDGSTFPSHGQRERLQPCRLRVCDSFSIAACVTVFCSRSPDGLR